MESQKPSLKNKHRGARPVRLERTISRFEVWRSFQSLGEWIVLSETALSN